ncbi:hypothetical protein AB1K70_10525 [Bremerella sp. JC770]|uniref:hypothetical protein n=1 Tax=Bremerella sp. JC770 TaxID=3232137 RepID=UPI00345B16FA
MLRQGMTSSLEAEVWYFPDEGDEAQAHYLEGPINQKATTLKSKYFFRPAKLSGNQAWKVIIPEPCLWSMQSPALYALNGEEPRIGLRDLRTRGESFYQEDRRWVVRAASSTSRNQEDRLASGLIPIHRQVDLPHVEACHRLGQPLILWPTANRPINLDQLSRYAAVSLVVLPWDTSPEVTAQAHSHLLLGADVGPGVSVPTWAKFVVVSEALIRGGWQPDRRLPVVVTRQYENDEMSGQEMRAQCDVFQASLDRGAEFAGLWLVCEYF